MKKGFPKRIKKIDVIKERLQKIKKDDLIKRGLVVGMSPLTPKEIKLNQNINTDVKNYPSRSKFNTKILTRRRIKKRKNDVFTPTIRDQRVQSPLHPRNLKNNFFINRKASQNETIRTRNNSRKIKSPESRNFSPGQGSSHITSFYFQHVEVYTYFKLVDSNLMFLYLLFGNL